jgi:hypothetical protein
MSNEHYSYAVNHLKIPIIDGIDMINESYTESLTVVIVSMLRAILTSITNNDATIVNDEFMKNIVNELYFSMFQYGKIINVYDGKNVDDYIQNKIIIQQNTSCRSYYIIKLFILLNISDFFDFLNRDMKVHDVRIKHFGELIQTSYDKFKLNNDIHEIINYYIKDIVQNKNKNIMNENSDNWIYDTFRMTVTDV